MHAPCHHDHAPDTALNDADRALALEAAEALCRLRGERMTGPRRRALELVLKAGGPVKAYELIDIFNDGSAAKPPTVYRALAFLEQLGLVHRIESLNAYIACQLGEQAHGAAFLVCDCCGTTREIEPNAAGMLAEAAASEGFTVHRITLEVRGRCRHCQTA